MSAEIPDHLPTVFSAGETVQFRRPVPDYLPPEGWTYALHLNGALAVLHKDGVADGNAYLVTILPTDSLSTGDYRYLDRVSNATTGEVHNVGSGVVKVEFDLALAAPGACISHAEQTLAIIEQQIEGKLSDDLASYSIGGRIVSKIPIDELKKLRAQNRAEVFRLYNPDKLAPSIEIVFNPLEGTHALRSTWIDVMGFLNDEPPEDRRSRSIVLRITAAERFLLPGSTSESPHPRLVGSDSLRRPGDQGKHEDAPRSRTRTRAEKSRLEPIPF